jgi:hypothetical protein
MKKVKPYIIVLTADHQYSNRPISLEEAKKDYPDSVQTIEAGTILWSQDNVFDIGQISEAKTKGFPHQWGFGPCCEQIPFEKLQFAKVEPFNI